MRSCDLLSTILYFVFLSNISLHIVLYMVLLLPILAKNLQNMTDMMPSGCVSRLLPVPDFKGGSCVHDSIPPQDLAQPVVLNSPLSIFTPIQAHPHLA
jgi:hypothetical protein